METELEAIEVLKHIYDNNGEVTLDVMNLIALMIQDKESTC